MEPLQTVFSLIFAGVGLMLLLRAVGRRSWIVLDATVTDSSPASRQVIATLPDPATTAPVALDWPRNRGLPRSGDQVRLTHPPDQPAAIRPHEGPLLHLLAGLLLIGAAAAPFLLPR